MMIHEHLLAHLAANSAVVSAFGNSPMRIGPMYYIEGSTPACTRAYYERIGCTRELGINGAVGPYQSAYRIVVNADNYDDLCRGAKALMEALHGQPCVNAGGWDWLKCAIAQDVVDNGGMECVLKLTLEHAGL